MELHNLKRINSNRSIYYQCGYGTTLHVVKNFRRFTNNSTFIWYIISYTDSWQCIYTTCAHM